MAINDLLTGVEAYPPGWAEQELLLPGLCPLTDSARLDLPGTIVYAEIGAFFARCNRMSKLSDKL